MCSDGGRVTPLPFNLLDESFIAPHLEIPFSALGLGVQNVSFHSPLSSHSVFSGAIGKLEISLDGDFHCLHGHEMGNQIITFTHDQLDHYQDCTFFNKKEILK
jgi:hypothetical protein